MDKEIEKLSEEEKLELLKATRNEDERTELIVSLDSDERKLELLKLKKLFRTIRRDENKLKIILSLKSDEAKLEVYRLIKNEFFHSFVIASLEKDENKFPYLKFAGNWENAIIIRTLKDTTRTVADRYRFCVEEAYEQKDPIRAIARYMMLQNDNEKLFRKVADGIVEKHKAREAEKGEENHDFSVQEATESVKNNDIRDVETEKEAVLEEILEKAEYFDMLEKEEHELKLSKDNSKTYVQAPEK